jgi:hypothetical protein
MRIGILLQHREPSTLLIDYSWKQWRGVTPFGNEQTIVEVAEDALHPALPA